MRELSIFVDESGDFGEYEKHSPFYIITMLLHDQSADISNQVRKLDDELIKLGLSGIAVHTEPLIRKEEIYVIYSPNDRRTIFTKLFYFAKSCDIQYKAFVYEKREFDDPLKLEARMHRDISYFIRDHLEFFNQFERVVLYYDNGQYQLNRILNMVLSTELPRYEMKKVLPVQYKLFQVADLICTLTLMEKKTEHGELTRSEMLLFHSKRDLKKEFLKKIKCKEFVE